MLLVVLPDKADTSGLRMRIAFLQPSTIESEAQPFNSPAYPLVLWRPVSSPVRPLLTQWIIIFLSSSRMLCILMFLLSFPPPSLFYSTRRPFNGRSDVGREGKIDCCSSTRPLHFVLSRRKQVSPARDFMSWVRVALHILPIFFVRCIDCDKNTSIES